MPVMMRQPGTHSEYYWSRGLTTAVIVTFLLVLYHHQPDARPHVIVHKPLSTIASDSVVQTVPSLPASVARTMDPADTNNAHSIVVPITKIPTRDSDSIDSGVDRRSRDALETNLLPDDSDADRKIDVLLAGERGLPRVLPEQEQERIVRQKTFSPEHKGGTASDHAVDQSDQDSRSAMMHDSHDTTRPASTPKRKASKLPTKALDDDDRTKVISNIRVPADALAVSESSLALSDQYVALHRRKLRDFVHNTAVVNTGPPAPERVSVAQAVGEFLDRPSTHACSRTTWRGYTAAGCVFERVIVRRGVVHLFKQDPGQRLHLDRRGYDRPEDQSMNFLWIKGWPKTNFSVQFHSYSPRDHPQVSESSSPPWPSQQHPTERLVAPGVCVALIAAPVFAIDHCWLGNFYHFLQETFAQLFATMWMEGFIWEDSNGDVVVDRDNYITTHWISVHNQGAPVKKPTWLPDVFRLLSRHPVFHGDQFFPVEQLCFSRLYVGFSQMFSHEFEPTDVETSLQERSKMRWRIHKFLNKAFGANLPYPAPSGVTDGLGSNDQFLGLQHSGYYHPVITIMDRHRPEGVSQFGKRELANRQEILRWCAAWNLTAQVAIFEQLSFAEAMQIMANTTLFLGVHSAGIANIGFLPEGAGFILIHPNVIFSFQPPYFDRLAATCRLAYSPWNMHCCDRPKSNAPIPVDRTELKTRILYLLQRGLHRTMPKTWTIDED